MDRVDPEPIESTSEDDFLDSLRRAFAREPRSGGAGQRGEFRPDSLSVAVSRETGSRGGTIARRTAQRLGWQFFDQELLEYLAHEKHLSRDLFQSLDEPASHWVEAQLQRLLREQSVSQNQEIVELARVILAIGARGDAVILGRGAGCILPSESTLHVRIIAPHDERIAYLTQFERMTPEQSAEQVELRDRQRALFMNTHFHRPPWDIYQYDLLLNSGKLGEELCTQLTVQAAESRAAARHSVPGAPPAAVPEPVDGSA